jgi:hypothetical protein
MRGQLFGPPLLPALRDGGFVQASVLSQQEFGPLAMRRLRPYTLEFDPRRRALMVLVVFVFVAVPSLAAAFVVFSLTQSWMATVLFLVVVCAPTATVFQLWLDTVRRGDPEP